MSFTEEIAINAFFSQFDNIFFAECMREFNRALAFYSERQKSVRAWNFGEHCHEACPQKQKMCWKLRIRFKLKGIFFITLPIIANVMRRPFVAEPLLDSRSIVMVLACISFITPMDDLICLMKVVPNIENTQKPLVLEWLNFSGCIPNDVISKHFELGS